MHTHARQNHAMASITKEWVGYRDTVSFGSTVQSFTLAKGIAWLRERERERERERGDAAHNPNNGRPRHQYKDNSMQEQSTSAP